MTRVEEYREMQRKEAEVVILRKEVAHLRTVLQIMSDAIKSAETAPWVAECWDRVVSEMDKYEEEK